MVRDGILHAFTRGEQLTRMVCTIMNSSTPHCSTAQPNIIIIKCLSLHTRKTLIKRFHPEDYVQLQYRVYLTYYSYT